MYAVCPNSNIISPLLALSLIKLDPEGCCVSAVWDPAKIKFEEDAQEELEEAAQKEVNNF